MDRKALKKKITIEPLTLKNWDKFVSLFGNKGACATSQKFRGMGVTAEMLRGAIDYAEAHGITILEGYPVIPASGKLPDAFAWFGTHSNCSINNPC